jgi:hypothetical protein
MKPIKFTEEYRKQCAEEAAVKAYNETLEKLQDTVACHKAGTTELETDKTIKVVLTNEVMLKATALVQECDKEIAWHGIVNANKEESIYTIIDVVVPPQEVTGTTVNSDSNEWALWASQLSDDEFNNLRCHMHSHVNMGVFSSATDDDYQKDVVTKDSNLDYYIFLIFNKKGEIFGRFYDVENNMMYDNKDVEVHIPVESPTIWAREQIKNMVQTKTYAPSAYGWQGAAQSYHQQMKSALDDDEDDDDYEYCGWVGARPTVKPTVKKPAKNPRKLRGKECTFSDVRFNTVFYHKGSDAEYLKISARTAMDTITGKEHTFHGNVKVICR